MNFNLETVYAVGDVLSVGGRFAVPVGLLPCYNPAGVCVEP
jgi:hypothetical protein